MKLPIPSAVLNQHIAVLAKTRSGKSSMMRLMVEGMLDDHRPVCVIDPKGDWWGLKSSADGKSAGYPVVIFGGPHGDVPINEHSGAAVAELFATGNRPCVVDLKGWMPGERTRFFVAFASTLFKLNHGLRWLVIDEIHNFAPKGQLADPDTAKALHWTNRLAGEGLGLGIHLIFASQRPQKVHNDTLTSAETLVAMRVLHPSDRGAVSDWIKGCGDPQLGAEVLNSLASLKRGEGWVWSPEIGFGPKRIQFPLFRTFDSFKPSEGQKIERLKGWAEIDLDEVRGKLSKAVEEAKANDPAALKAEIGRLRALAAKLEKVRPDTVLSDKPSPKDNATIRGLRSALEAAVKFIIEISTQGFDVPGVEKVEIDKAMVAAAAQLEKLVERNIGQRNAAIDRMRLDAQRLAARLRKLIDDEDVTIKMDVRHNQPFDVSGAVKNGRGHSTGPAIKTAQPQTNINNNALPEGERAILIAMAQTGDFITREQASILTGYKRSTRDAYIQRLIGKGFAMTNGSGVGATDAGVTALGADYMPLPTGDALLQYWLGKLPEGERKTLDAVCSAYPNAVDRDAISDVTGYKRSTRDAYLQRLRTRKLIVAVGTQIKAAPILFDGGSR